MINFKEDGFTGRRKMWEARAVRSCGRPAENASRSQSCKSAVAAADGHPGETTSSRRPSSA